MEIKCTNCTIDMKKAAVSASGGYVLVEEKKASMLKFVA